MLGPEIKSEVKAKIKENLLFFPLPFTLLLLEEGQRETHCLEKKHREAENKAQVHKHTQ